MRLTAVIACHRDAQAVPFMYSRLVAAFASVPADYEIIFVNDGSPDNAREVLAELAATDPKVTVINHTRAFGSQSAFTSGMQIATGDAVILFDGDLQDPPELIPALVERWQAGFDVVYGERVDREAPWLMRIFYKAFYRIFRKASYVPIPLDAGDFGLLDRRVVDALNELPEKQRFIRGLRAWVGFKQTGVPYKRPERMFGTSTNSLLRNLGWARRAILSFSYKPIDAIAWIALTTVALSVVAIGVQIVARIAFPDLVPRGITTILVVILFLGGIQLLCLSIIGAYLAQIYEEVKSRPAYLVDEIVNPPPARTEAVPPGAAPGDPPVPPAAPVTSTPPVVRQTAPPSTTGGSRRVVVTGAAGFVGSQLVHRLVTDGHRVTAFARPGSDLWRLDPVAGDIEILPVDLRDDARVRDTVAATRPEWVFHLAAHGAYSWQKDVPRIMATNLLGTVSLVNACLDTGCESFVHAGSSSEYGLKDHPADEDEAVDPASDYAVAKASATAYCRAVARSHGFNAVTLRLYSVYGPYEEPRRLMPTLVSHGMRKRLPALVRPDVAHDFVAVGDVVEAFVLAAAPLAEGRDPGAVYNVGSGVQTTLREAVDVARRVLDIDVEPVWDTMPERELDTTTWVACTDRIRRQLGWVPTTDLRTGFAGMVDWLRETPLVWGRYGLGASDEPVPQVTTP